MSIEEFSAIILGIGLIILLCAILFQVGNIKPDYSLPLTKENEKVFEELDHDAINLNVSNKTL